MWVQASCGPVDATGGCCVTSSSRVSIQSLESEWGLACFLSSDVRGDDAVHRGLRHAIDDAESGDEERDVRFPEWTPDGRRLAWTDGPTREVL